MESVIESLPLVSVILPVYNGEKTIKRALVSVLTQTYKNLEVIVVNDGSTDNTVTIIKSIADSRIRIENLEKNCGIQKTLRHGVIAARGRYIARIDADDWWLEKDKLEKQVQFLEGNSDHVLIGTNIVIFSEDEQELGRSSFPTTDNEIRKKILFSNCFAHTSVVFTREKALSCGNYSDHPDVRYVEDYDLWLRMGKVGRFANLPQHLTAYTLSEGGLTSMNKVEQLKAHRRLVRKYDPDYSLSLAKRITREVSMFFVIILLRFIDTKKLRKWYRKIKN